MNENNKITDINDLVLNITCLAMKPLLNDDVWQCYGYKKIPKHGVILEKIFPKMFILENFISREVLTMGLIDVLNGIKKTSEAPNIKFLISVGVIDQFLFTTKNMFSADFFMENLFLTYASYLKNKKLKIYEPIILKAKSMVGTIQLFATEHGTEFFLKTNYIKKVIEKSGKENKLKILMSDKIYKKYVLLIEEKILNT